MCSSSTDMCFKYDIQSVLQYIMYYYYLNKSHCDQTIGNNYKNN